MATVSIVKATYSGIGIETLLEPHGGMGQFVEKSEKVLLKVNLLSGKAPEKAVTTYPDFVRAVARAGKKAGESLLLETLQREPFPKEVLPRQNTMLSSHEESVLQT